MGPTRGRTPGGIPSGLHCCCSVHLSSRCRRLRRFRHYYNRHRPNQTLDARRGGAELDSALFRNLSVCFKRACRAATLIYPRLSSVYEHVPVADIYHPTAMVSGQMGRTRRSIYALLEAAPFGSATGGGVYYLLGATGGKVAAVVMIAGIIGLLVFCGVATLSYLLTLRAGKPFPILRFLLELGL